MKRVATVLIMLALLAVPVQAQVQPMVSAVLVDLNGNPIPASHVFANGDRFAIAVDTELTTEDGQLATLAWDPRMEWTSISGSVCGVGPTGPKTSLACLPRFLASPDFPGWVLVTMTYHAEPGNVKPMTFTATHAGQTATLTIQVASTQGHRVYLPLVAR